MSGSDNPGSGVRRSLILNLLMLLALTGVGVWWTEPASIRRDIGLADESSYMRRGLAILDGGTPNVQYSPLYSAWYLAISPFADDRVDLYYLTYRATIVGMPVAFATFLLAAGIGRWTTLALALVLLISPLNQDIWPRVSHFSLILLFFGSAWTLGLSSRRDRFVLGLLVGLSLSLVRPELFLGTVLLAGMVAVEGWRALATRRRRALLRGTLVVTVGLLGGAYSLAFLGGGDRQWVAFGQHYAFASTPPRSDVNPWTQWRRIVARDFGEAEGVAAAFVADPSAFAVHAGKNALRSPGALTAMFGRMVADRSARLVGGILLAAMLWVAGLGTRRRVYSPGSRERSKRLGELALSLSILLSPVLLSILILYPRPHYLMLFAVPAVALWAARFLPRGSAAPSVTRTVQLVALAAAVSGALASEISARAIIWSQPRLEMLQAIRQADFEPPLVIVEAEGADGGFCKFLEVPCRRVAPEAGEETVGEMLRDPEVDVFVASEAMETYPWIREDPDWEKLLDEPGRFGFRRSPVHPAVFIRPPRGDWTPGPEDTPGAGSP